MEPLSANPEPAHLVDRIESIEREMQFNAGLIRQLTEAMEGLAANQRRLAINQAMLIQSLDQIAARTYQP